ncbi:MAG: fumarylacetoacetate hydrolase family protein [Acetobacterales bacterium]
MVEYVIKPPETPALPVAGTGQMFPVRRIYCVGRNYAEHAREMGHDPDREPPFFFAKPADAAPHDGQVPFPAATADLHHEVEMVVAIGKGGSDIAVGDALNHIYGYSVGIDFTRRDLQAEAKKMARPWATAKGFDHSGPCGAIRPASEIGHPDSGRIWLKVNGETRQESDLTDLIWKTPEVVSHLSGLFRLEPGDLIMTGTPSGVAQVVRGDKLECGVDGIGTLTVKLV